MNKEKVILRKSVFDQLNSYVETNHDYSVLNINGIGGIGKSQIINDFVEELKEKNIYYALIDGKQDGIKSLVVNKKTICNLVEFSKYISNYSNNNKQFYKEYRAIIERFEMISLKYSKYISNQNFDISPYEGIIESSIGGSIGTLVAGIPGAILGAALGGVSGKTLKYFGREVNKLLKIGFNEDDAKFCVSIEKEISRTLIIGINRVIESTGKYVLFIDSYDDIQSIENWLFSDFLSNMNNEQFRLVIASRCNINVCELMKVKVIELQPFTFNQCEIYLDGLDLSKNDIEKIYSISKGIPWILSLIKSGDYLNTDFYNEKIENFQFVHAKQTVDYILSNIESIKLKKLIEFTSITPSFNLDLISYCLTDIESDDEEVTDLFSLNFVKQLPDGKHYISDTIRQLMVNYLLVEKPLLITSWNNKIEKYYRELMKISPHDITAKYLWDYLSSYYFDDSHARELFLPENIYLNQIYVLSPRFEELEQVYKIDQVAMGFDPEFEYSLDDLQNFYDVDSNNFSVSINTKTNRVTGYSLLLKPDREWCKSFENCSQFEIHPANLLSHSDNNNVYNDYLIDTLVVENLSDKTSTYMLMRDILRKLTNPRKIYTLAITKHGVDIARKLEMNYLQTITSANNNPLECYYLCLYNTVINSPIHIALQKKCKKISNINPCLDCMIEQCENKNS